jgi:glutathione synthase/RimK-type ligase-like ATP-grasp enzyme
MLVAIHNRDGGFSKQWIKYCKEKKIPYKTINCYDNDIINQLKGVSHLLWHYHRYEVKNGHVASQLLGVFENMGIKVFPNFNTRLSFDEKILQKYLLESIEAPLPETTIFFDELKAISWVNTKMVTPKVFKLSKGAGSKNVSLVNSKKALLKVKQMFSTGVSSFVTPKFKLNSKPFYNIYRHFFKRKPLTTYKNKMVGKEFGYAYFQEFLPNNDHDIRVITFRDKAIAAKRMVANNSFKASGSGKFFYDKDLIPKECIEKAFETSRKLNFQFMAYDFVKHSTKGYLIVEICPGVSARFYDKTEGYWNTELEWCETNSFVLEHYIIADLLNEVIL